MLLELNITNIALIEKLRVEFNPGLNVLTGETGAGKSIVIDAMNLALGGRADRELIRGGAARAGAQAVFDVRGNARASAMLAGMGLEAEEHIVTLGRELSAEGRNICRACGAVVPLSQLRALAGALVETHGQHESQILLDGASHLDALDTYGGAELASLINDARGAHAGYSQARNDLDRLTRELGERERMMGALSAQLEEINRVKPKKSEDEALELKFKVMGSAEKVSSSLDIACRLIYQGNERAPSAQEALKRAFMAMGDIEGLDGRFAAMHSRLGELYFQAQDAGYELQALMDDMEFDPDEFDRIGGRLNALDQLKRKYGPSLDEVIEFRDRAAARLAALSRGDELLEDLRGGCDKLKADMDQKCAVLTAARQQLAERLSAEMETQLSELGMPRARFQARVEAAQPGARGADKIQFMISLNPGEPIRPMADTASGGELSRIMLALKTIMAGRNEVKVIIFDEIDAGIGGRMAQVVGEKMASLGAGLQVIAVSHLPQIAALADAHYAVEKIEAGNRTGTVVRRLNERERVNELARMVGGAGGMGSGLAHAANMLAEAGKWKASALTCGRACP